jgi:hypothetical protein
LIQILKEALSRPAAVRQEISLVDPDAHGVHIGRPGIPLSPLLGPHEPNNSGAPLMQLE